MTCPKCDSEMRYSSKTKSMVCDECGFLKVPVSLKKKRRF